MKKTFLMWSVTVVFMLLSVNTQARQWHVAPEGRAGNPGTEAKPFATLPQARDTIRDYRKSGEVSELQTVIIHEGNYILNETFVLEKQDSNTVYRAADSVVVTVSTGTDIPSGLFRSAAGIELKYLKAEARNKVIVANLKDNAIAKLFTKGYGDYGMLTWDQYTMQLAQWPNRGYSHLNKVINMGPTLRWLIKGEKEAPYSFENPIGGKFTLREKTDFAAWQKELKRTQDVLQDGYLSIDWAKDSNRLARVSKNGVLQLLDSTNYGIGGVRYRGGFADPTHKPTFMPHRRLVFKNLLCELDMPGEWYFDRIDKKLYIWPITEDYRKARIAIPGGPLMVKLTDTRDVTLRGIIFENGGKSGLTINGGSNNMIAACTFRNFYGRAATISGHNNGFNGCDFYNLQSAFSLNGGNLKTLTRSDNYVINCDIHHLRNCGYGGAGLSGCGIIFKNNIYHDTNAGIQYSGVYIEFTNNEFYNVGWEMGDWNVLYQGAKKWCNGNLVKNNFFHHFMEEPTRYPVLGARNDDGGTGTMYKSNIFYKTGRGALAFGGPNSHIQDNIVLDCGLIWWTGKAATLPEEIQKRYDEIAKQFESGRYPRGGKEDAIYNVEKVVGKEGWNKEPWKSAFPNFAKYMTENPFAQSYGSMLNNYHNKVNPSDPYKVVHVHGSWSLLPETGEKVYPSMKDMPKSFRYNAPRKIDIKTDFVDPECLNFTLKSGFKPMPGFAACDLSKVGLFKSEYRPNPPSQDDIRRAIYERFKSTPSSGGGYNYDTVHLRYPLQPWIEVD